MKKPLNPAVAWVVIIVIVVAAVGIGYKMLSPAPVNYDTKGSEQMMEKVKGGGKMYDPPGKMGFNGKFVPPGQGNWYPNQHTILLR